MLIIINLKNMLDNSQNQVNSSTKSHIINYSSVSGKTRVDSLMDRIQSANEQINSILENPNPKIIQNENNEKIVQFPSSTKENENNSSTQPQKLLNEIISDENNKSIQVGLDDNANKNENQVSNETKENNENKEKNSNNNNTNLPIDKKDNAFKNEIDIPFIKRTKNLLNELKKLKEKGQVKEDDINNEVSELPKRAMLEMSLSDFKIKKKCELLQKELEDKNNYIKTLENEIVNQRSENTNLKKSEGEYLLKISALEDELRVMKMKLLGYNTSEQYNNQHNHEVFNTDANNCGHIYGEKLVQSMWIRNDNLPKNNNNLNTYNNLEFQNSRPILNTNERRKLPMISNSHGNLSRFVRNINLNNNENDMRGIQTENILFSENENMNSFNSFSHNGRYDNFKPNNNNFNGGGNSNFQRISEMILRTPNKLNVNRNFRNEFNRFRIGNNNNF